MRPISFFTAIKDAALRMVNSTPRTRIFDHLAKGPVGTWGVDINGTHFIFPSDSWELARGAGVTDFRDVLGRLHDNTFRVIEYISKLHYVAAVRITSAWRPGNPDTDVHAAGRALDIGQVHFSDSSVWYNRDGAGVQVEPEQSKRFREAIIASGLVWQWIGPWWIKYRTVAPWLPNYGSDDLQRQHRNHIHLTISA
jgi:hypothetical protein